MLHLNNKEHLGTIDSKSDEGVFLGYSNNNRAYRVYNIRTQTIMESANVVVDDFNDSSTFSKEKKITIFSNENVETFGAEQIVEAKSNNVATSVNTI